MADLFDLIFQDPGELLPEGNTIGVNTFYAGIVDYVAGDTTRNQIVNFLQLTGAEVTDLDTLLAAVDAIATLDGKISWLMQLDAVLTLAKQGIKYNTKSAFAARLGL